MFKHVLKDRLGRRLVLYSLLVSTLMSTIASGIQLSVSYQRQRADTSEIFDQIEKTLASPLEKALWQYDFEQVDVILDGIYANNAVAKLRLEMPSGQVWERGAENPYDLEQVNLLNYVPPNNHDVLVGTLTTFLSLDRVNNRIWAQLWTLLASNLVKAYLSASVMLFLYFILVGKPLTEIEAFIKNPDSKEDQDDLVLSRIPNKNKDVLDQITLALNSSKLSLAQRLTQLKSEIVTRKAAEADALKAFEVRKVFLANMSHEVRTPLNAIMGLFQLIQMADVPERQKKQAKVGLDASHHLLAQLVNGLEISRVEADAVTIQLEKTDIRSLADQWLETATATAHRLEKPIQVSLEIADETPVHCMLDARRVTQIVNNLSDNALKFTKKGRVLIEVGIRPASGETNPSRLEIIVSDTGCGIPKEQLEAIFDRFYQVDDAQTRENSGSGLGLAISRELAMLMGGSLEAYSSSKNKIFVTSFVLNLELNN